jgi:hypothetical protein
VSARPVWAPWRGARPARQRVAVAFEGGAFVVGEVEALQHLLDTLFDSQQLPGAGFLGQVEGATGAGQPVRALGEEVVGTVAVAEVVQTRDGIRIRGGKSASVQWSEVKSALVEKAGPQRAPRAVCARRQIHDISGSGGRLDDAGPRV